uniref:Uncharacterized protein n=1 Tax=Brassica oleracea TaxID=3712 RepID=A0A3P6G040_BRAOL|nr:unnamed protein product [Brassica oleracea]
MVSSDPVPGRQRLAQICRRRFYLRGVEVSTAPPSSVKFPGCEGIVDIGILSPSRRRKSFDDSWASSRELCMF